MTHRLKSHTVASTMYLAFKGQNVTYDILKTWLRMNKWSESSLGSAMKTLALQNKISRHGVYGRYIVTFHKGTFLS